MSWYIKMRVLKCMPAATTFPTGDKSFAVKQGFPDPISAEEADPFLMCDHFVRAQPLNQLAPACAYSLSCVCPFTRPCMALRRPCRRAPSARMSSLCRGTPIEAWTSSPTSCKAKAATPTPWATAAHSRALECSGSGRTETTSLLLSACAAAYVCSDAAQCGQRHRARRRRRMRCHIGRFPN